MKTVCEGGLVLTSYVPGLGKAAILMPHTMELAAIPRAEEDGFVQSGPCDTVPNVRTLREQ